MTDADLLHSLRDCYDPLLKLNIVDRNLVRSAHLTPDLDAPGATIPSNPTRYIAHITLTAPTSDEAANAQLLAQIENRLAGLPSISHTQITLLPTPFPIL